MQRPHVYGDEAAFRKVVRRYIASGETLLAQGEGAQRRIDAFSDERESRMARYAIEEGWEKEFRRWFGTTYRGTGKFLQDQFHDLMPVLSSGLPPDTGKPRHTIHLPEGREWLAKTVEELKEALDAIGPTPTSQRTGSVGMPEAILPIAPLAGLGLIALTAMQSSIRSRYMRRLESEIRRMIGLLDSNVRPLPKAIEDRDEAERGYLIRWTDLTNAINGIRGGQTLYKLIVQGLAAGIVLLYLGLLIYIGLHVGRWSQAWMTGIYTVGAAILIGSLFKSWYGTDASWEEVTTALVLRVNPAAAEAEEELQPMPGRVPPARRPSLMRYLLFPRTTFLFIRLWLTFLVTLALAYPFSSRSPDGSWLHVFAIAAAFSVLFELGPYSARNQWTDLRRRERLPYAPTGASHRANIYTSATVMAIRVIVPYLWIASLAPRFAFWAIVVALVLWSSIVIDSAMEFRERQKDARTHLTRFGEYVGRVTAFVARGIVAWRVAVYSGAEIEAPVYVAAIVALGLLGAPWILYRQIRDSREPSDRRLQRASDWFQGERAKAKAIPGWLGNLLLGRAFEQWERRRGDG